MGIKPNQKFVDETVTDDMKQSAMNQSVEGEPSKRKSKWHQL